MPERIGKLVPHFAGFESPKVSLTRDLSLPAVPKAHLALMLRQNIAQQRLRAVVASSKTRPLHYGGCKFKSLRLAYPTCRWSLSRRREERHRDKWDFFAKLLVGSIEWNVARSLWVATGGGRARVQSASSNWHRCARTMHTRYAAGAYWLSLLSATVSSSLESVEMRAGNRR